MSEALDLAAAAGAARPAAATDPPLLTGGSGQDGMECLGGKVMGRGVDWLTVTVGTETASALLAATVLDEAGRAKAGFERSERRQCLGGKCWRKWEPRQASKRFGRDYESWEWSGAVSDWASRWLRGREDVKPTRVDVAWDLEVPESMTADRAWEAIAGHVERARLSPGISGQGGVNTRYVGASSSTARVRIYRKDLQSESWLLQFGPTLRVELVLKGERAESWWRLLNDDPEGAFGAAAGELERMTGLVVQRERQELAQLMPAEAANEGQRAFQFMKQHGSSLDAMIRAGLPVFDLAAEAARWASRNTRHVAKKRVEAIRKAGPAEVTAFVMAMLLAAAERSA